MRLLLALLALLAIIVLSSGCLPSRTITTAPSLTRDALLALLVRADVARQQAFETGDPTPHGRGGRGARRG